MSLEIILPQISHLEVFVLYILTSVPSAIGLSSFAVLSYSTFVFSAICRFRSVALTTSPRGTKPPLLTVGRNDLILLCINISDGLTLNFGDGVALYTWTIA